MRRFSDPLTDDEILFLASQEQQQRMREQERQIEMEMIREQQIQSMNDTQQMMTNQFGQMNNMPM